MKNEDVTKWANRYGLDKFPSELRAMINDAHKLVQQEDDLYTTPPAAQRPWVGLTDEEIDQAWRSLDYTVSWEQHRIDIARAIEAAHGITGEKT